MKAHQPAAVLERPEQFWYCLACSQPWPCQYAPEEETHD